MSKGVTGLSRVKVRPRTQGWSKIKGNLNVEITSLEAFLEKE